jgi:hypothetical protein
MLVVRDLRGGEFCWGFAEFGRSREGPYAKTRTGALPSVLRLEHDRPVSRCVAPKGADRQL